VIAISSIFARASFFLSMVDTSVFPCFEVVKHNNLDGASCYHPLRRESRRFSEKLCAVAIAPDHPGETRLASAPPSGERHPLEGGAFRRVMGSAAIGKRRSHGASPGRGQSEEGSFLISVAPAVQQAQDATVVLLV
jgi:hypothetical protein